MHPTHLLGGTLLLAALGWFAVRPDAATPPLDPPAAPPQQPVADGHFTLVVEGDRDRLAVTHAVAKRDPWAGAQKGLTSAWVLRVFAGETLLAEVPLDLSKFDTRAERKGGGIEVEGCIVHDPRIAMLVNVPRFAEATLYAFVRRDGQGEVPVGADTGDRVRQLAGGGR